MKEEKWGRECFRQKKVQTRQGGPWFEKGRERKSVTEFKIHFLKTDVKHHLSSFFQGYHDCFSLQKHILPILGYLHCLLLNDTHLLFLSIWFTASYATANNDYLLYCIEQSWSSKRCGIELKEVFDCTVCGITSPDHPPSPHFQKAQLAAGLWPGLCTVGHTFNQQWVRTTPMIHRPSEF